MWRFTPYPVKFFIWDGRLFIILLLSLLVMPAIGWPAASIISTVSLILFWVVEKFGFDVDMVLRWLRCRMAGNYQSSAGARFDQPRKRWTTLYTLIGLMALGGQYPEPVSADFMVTDPAIVDKVAELNKPAPLKDGEHGVFVGSPCNNKVGVHDLDEAPIKIEHVTKQGQNIPLKIALKAILPRGWHADKAFDVDHDLLLSWGKGEEFTTVLFDWANEHNLSIKIAWKKKKVSVYAACKESSDLQEATNKIEAAALLPTKAPEPPPKPSAYYMLHSGEMLGVALQAWCDMANKAEPGGALWTLKWKAATDQPIDADSYYGDHISSAIDKLTATLSANNLPFRVAEYANHVIIVTN
jgi:hypothetical protein